MKVVELGTQDALPSLEDCYDELLQIVGRNYPSVPWQLMKAQMRQESQFNPLAVSPTGPVGLFQFARATWADYNPDDHRGLKRRDIYRAILTAYRHMTELIFWSAKRGMTKEDITRLALAAYNQGQGTIGKAQQWCASQGADPMQYGNIMRGLEAILKPADYRQVSDYVAHIMDWFAHYAAASGPEVTA